MYTFCIAIIHFKRSHNENKVRQLDKFTFNLSIFINEMFSLQNPFLNWIVNIRLSIIYLLYACRVQSVVPPLLPRKKFNEINKVSVCLYFHNLEVTWKKKHIDRSISRHSRFGLNNSIYTGPYCLHNNRSFWKRSRTNG